MSSGTWSRAGEVLEFNIPVDGGYTFRDVEIFPTPMLFKTPAYGVGFENLSKREGTVCIKQKGWNTGWYRTENRMCGVYRIEEITERVKRRDGY